MAGSMLEDVISSIESCGGLNLIEDLQQNVNPSIFKSAYNILEMLYGSNYDETVAAEEEFDAANSGSGNNPPSGDGNEDTFTFAAKTDNMLFDF
ncbi:unnamed protein product [Hydatigera taeniaeformis]|uniref:Importin subunit alpha-1-like n=1 Tax=Hydatigena taeniaeformis TaxID=6205 RepID=A0A0R3XAD8_HYDTA|nr:unnamed protein product [Hydatigera taeniaeformis]